MRFMFGMQKGSPRPQKVETQKEGSGGGGGRSPRVDVDAVSGVAGAREEPGRDGVW